jgi:GNAT superfamily N-acetyltransferase
VETKTISMQEVAAFTRARMLPAIGILFVGDRFHCCDEGVGVFAEGELVGIATIAPEGEQGSGEPTIVGLYVVPEYRRRGIGTELMRAAVERCRERGFARVRVDVMSTGAKKAVARLPEALREVLDIHDLGAVMDMMP